MNDLCASGDGTCAMGAIPPRPDSLARPPPILGVVLAQNAQMYTGGMSRLVMLMHLPCSHSSQASLLPVR